METNDNLKDLGGGLRMRCASPGDADRLCAFNARIHGDDPDDGAAIAAWTRDLLCLPHPTFRPEDFTLVEDLTTGEIVSSMNLISQTWTYDGIPFGVGRPELVGTDLKYRGRGLVREQFAVAHEWSRQRGELLQAITGIPFFYRQFGYEMGLELGCGRTGYETHVPALAEGQEEAYQFRPALETDIPFLMRCYERECRRSLVSVVRSEADWRYELCGRSANNVNRWEVRLITDRQGAPVGYLAHPFHAWGDTMALMRMALDEGVSYLAVMPCVLRYLWKTGKELAPQRGKQLKAFGLRLGSSHPAYDVLPRIQPGKDEGYAYYMRVPDLPAFLRRIAPALEARLYESACAGHSGELNINFYRGGVRLCFEQGRLTQVEGWQPGTPNSPASAAFPNLTFLQLLFGYRSLAEIRYAFPDCTASESATALLNALFPRRPSNAWSIS